MESAIDKNLIASSVNSLDYVINRGLIDRENYNEISGEGEGNVKNLKL